MDKRYFFCGVGGSGMMPLALILKAQGAVVSGSDRAYDQGASPKKFSNLQSLGIDLYPQNGSGLAGADVLVVSGAIEDSVPDVAAAKAAGIPIETRAQLLSGLFNASPCGISIAGTSGKSSVTGMVASIFDAVGLNPTVMNGGMITNFEGNPACPAANMRTGASDVFITETDESDGSIALYHPAIALVNNIALDHMPLEELKAIFAAFLKRAKQAVVVNGDDENVMALLDGVGVPIYRYSFNQAKDVTYHPDGVDFTVEGLPVHLRVPGRHNVMNALAALSVAKAYGVELAEAIKGLERFTGIARRMQLIGEASGIKVYDDFGHNPDKISASLQSLKRFDGRLLVMFQAHGFGPLRLMGREIVEAFAAHLGAEDQLVMPEVFYAGGTVDRSVQAKDVIGWAQEAGVNAHWFDKRESIADWLIEQAHSGDRIVIMGARDDSLTTFAQGVLARI